MLNVFRRSADSHSQLQGCFFTGNCQLFATDIRRKGRDWTKEKYADRAKISSFFFFLSEQIPFQHNNKNNKNNNNETQDWRRAKFAFRIFKHCWFGSQPWMPIVAYALYTLYFKSISAMAGQPEGEARNFPLKQKKTHCSQGLCFKLTPAFLLSCVRLTASEQSCSTSVIVFKGLEIASDL